MSMSGKRKALFLPVAVPIVAALLGGCTYGDKTQPAPISMPAQNPVPVTSVAPPTPVVGNPAPAPVVVSPAPAPVVVAPAPMTATPVVVAPAPTTATPVVVAPAPTTATPVVVAPAPTGSYPTIINYADGRYQLYGDAGSGYYWVWIPTGATAVSAPVPPAVPRGTNVVLAPAQRQVVYPEGRYELFGDANNGYYWAWIPSGMTPPAPPPPWRVSQQR
jgi:hypothetical protein